MKIKIKKPWGNPNCTACGLHETAQCVCLMGQGPKPAKAMIIGEAPGYREDEIQKPFSGKAGQALMEMIGNVGLTREDVYITNAVHCRPPSNRTPTKVEVKACKQYLDREIERVNPSVVLVLGATAMLATLGITGVTANRGKIVEANGRKYLITMHPALLFRQPNLKSQLQEDLRKFSKLVAGEEIESPKDGLRWTLIDSSDKLRAATVWLSNAKDVEYDIEGRLTSMGEIWLLGFGDDQRQWALPLDYPGAPFQKAKLQRMVMGALKPLFHKAGVGYGAQNGKFDNKRLREMYGWCPDQTDDTMQMGSLLNENDPHGLEYMARLYLGADSWKIDWKGFNPYTYPLKDLAKYNCEDILYTAKLKKYLKKELAKDARLQNFYEKLIMPTSRMLEDLELGGIYIDQEKYPVVLDQVTREVDELLVQLDGWAPKRELPEGMNPNTKKAQKLLTFNWGSTAQVGQFLFGELGIDPIEVTGKGAPSTKESVLLQLRDAHPCVAALLKYRERLKLQQFLTSWGNFMDDKGFIHPTISLGKMPGQDEDEKETGTVTGRLSYKDPNLQQTPRDPLLRSLITAPPGWIFWEADYSQVELRIVAMTANDPTMKRIFQTGGDIHSYTASQISGKPEDKLTSEERKKAKAVNFGFIYGMWWKKFKEYARDKYGVHLTDGESEAYRTKFFEMFDALPAWHERQKRIVRKWGYVRTGMGRIRHLPDIFSPEEFKRKQAERQAINSPIQGFASDMCLFAGNRIHRQYKPTENRVLGFIHDAIAGMTYVGDSKNPNDILFPVLAEVKRIMEDTDTLDATFGCRTTVPIISEVKYGAWGMGTKFKG